MLKATIQKNDKAAYWFIGVVSAVVFTAVVFLSKFTLQVDLGFDPHIFAAINAGVNTIVSFLLILALLFVSNRNYVAHKNAMLGAIVMSVLFLLSYIAHHLFAGETKFGGEGLIRPFYYILLITHIILAAVIMPLILFTAYRGLTGEYGRHKKLARYTFPIWLYVSVSGVIVYLLISPYYS
ncbi:MAG: DUF420 domain-containing protein [Bacteroidetes bacterium]|nr:DUF420 domain-containing protein [Bacteroidota bacterium]